MKLSPHFTLDEATYSTTAIRRGIINQPTTMQIGQMQFAAEGMELIRDLLGVPIQVTSWFRCKELNEAVGGSGRSAHMDGFAVDFTAPRFGTPLAICKTILGSDLKFDQLIHEGTWVHISFAPRLAGQVLTAHFRAGQPVTYTKGLP